ncbi:MAG TPA: sulfite exporter TauE/SafE family protein [Gemmatimonadales bacterium]|nr:sulfite exporter TauE/SafE family protein [Gemmatimonadales bacterium]
MNNPKLLLFLALGVVGLVYLVSWGRALRAGASVGNGAAVPSPLETAIGFATNFFDTLGIGSYAPTTALFRFFRLVPDEKIPGTLTLGHTLPTIVQSFIFIAIVQVDFATLTLLIGASIVGAWLGAGVVARWPKRNIQIGMGLALCAAAGLFLMANLGIVAGGGTATGLTGAKLVAGLVGNFILGALMTLGIGLYGPCLIMISLLGMEPRAAFPIMMASCAFLMPVAGVKFSRAQAYTARPALGLALGGIPAVLIAALIVKSMSLVAVRWLVIVVVLYTAVGLLRSAFSARPEPSTGGPTP